MTDQVTIMRLPITLPCPVPVMAGTGDTLDGDGDPIPLEDRGELCAVDAAWMMGAQIVCDVHLKVACRFLGIDFDELVEETYGGYGPSALAAARATADVPWSERKRYADRISPASAAGISDVSEEVS